MKASYVSTGTRDFSGAPGWFYSKAPAAMACKPKSSSNGDAGYVDAYRGWYDVQGCGQCNDYCRWVGNSGAGGSPTLKLSHGSSFWSCRLAGNPAPYSSNG